MRNKFIECLTKYAREHEHIVLIVGDLGYGVVEEFADTFPNRFFNAGVAEQNMAGLAAGLASEGCHVFTYSIANFPTFRCAEQIRNDIAYHNLSVTTVSVGGGLAYGALGYSHHAVQDFALMRAMPNMTIYSPGDPVEVEACLQHLVTHGGPSYFRLGKTGEKPFHTNKPKILDGSWLPIKVSGHDKAIVTTGTALQYVNEFADPIGLNSSDLYSLPVWSMTSKHAQSKWLESYQTVVTFENHLLDGGFGSWLLEAASQIPNLNTKIKPSFLQDSVCGEVGSETALTMASQVIPPL